MAMPEELIAIAVRAADAAARELLARADRPSSGLGTKSTDTDLVSDADRAAERAVMDVLDAERPEDGLRAEEGGSRQGTSGFAWVVDPLDGTTNYLWGIPHWGVSVAVCDAHGPVAATVLHPSRGERFTAVRGRGAWLDGRRLRIPPPPPLDKALVGTGFNYSPAERGRQAEVLVRVMPQVRDVRRFGAAALDLAWVAAGRLDAFIERGVQEWDWMAGRLLVSEAEGGVALLEATDERPAGIAVAHPDLLVDLLALFETGSGGA